MSFWKQFGLSALLLAGVFAIWGMMTLPGRAFLAKTGFAAVLAEPADGAVATAKPSPSTNGAASKSGQSDVKSADQKQAQGQTATAQSGRGGRGPRTNLVVTEPATKQTTDDRVAALGVASALHSVTLNPMASGQITTLPLKSGAKVTVGTVIATLDDQTQRTARDAADLALKDAQATLARNQQLSTGNIVAGSQMQAYQLAESQAELALRTAELNLSYRTVVAPISGTLGLLQVDIGAQVTTQTVVATIEDNSSLTIDYALPERLVSRVSIGDTVTLSPVSQPEIMLKGTISAIDNRVDSTSGTFAVQASLPNPDGKLQSGMSFTVDISFPGEANIAVSPLAVQWGSDGSYVWRLKDGKTVQKVPIRIIQRNSDSVQVAGDLAAGDAIVTEGLDGLKDGAPVKLLGADGGGDATKTQTNGAAAPAKN